MDGIKPLSEMSLHSSGICCVIFSYLFTIHIESLQREREEGYQEKLFQARDL